MAFDWRLRRRGAITKSLYSRSNNPLSVWLFTSPSANNEIHSNQAIFTRFPGSYKAFWNGQKAISFPVDLYSTRRLRFIFPSLAYMYSPAILPSKKTARYLWRITFLFPPPRPPFCHHMAGISRFPRDHWRMSSEHLCPSLSPSHSLGVEWPV